MQGHMPDSPLNEPERGLQHSFMKSPVFNSLAVLGVVLATYIQIRELPDRRLLPPREVALNVRPVELPVAPGPLWIAGAWVLTADDPRFGGLSGLAIDGTRFLAVSDLGGVVRFDPPSASQPLASLADLPAGPGPLGRKTSRDAEAVVRDPRGRGWWVAYEQRHSLWLYDDDFRRAQAEVTIEKPDWWSNRGIEAAIPDSEGLLVFAENGRETIRVGADGVHGASLEAGWDVADAARAPDGTAWLLLRTKGRQGITQAIAPLIQAGKGYRIGRAWPLPKAALDNYEGMVIAPKPGGGWRFWLVTDDGHRFRARTLLVALDLDARKNARR